MESFREVLEEAHTEQLQLQGQIISPGRGGTANASTGPSSLATSEKAQTTTLPTQPVV